jgi:hypothetical protein
MYIIGIYIINKFIYFYIYILLTNYKNLLIKNPKF